jgi:regulator of replication initiation timing
MSYKNDDLAQASAGADKLMRENQGLKEENATFRERLERQERQLRRREKGRKVIKLLKNKIVLTIITIFIYSFTIGICYSRFLKDCDGDIVHNKNTPCFVKCGYYATFWPISYPIKLGIDIAGGTQEYDKLTAASQRIADLEQALSTCLKRLEEAEEERKEKR